MHSHLAVEDRRLATVAAVVGCKVDVSGVEAAVGTAGVARVTPCRPRLGPVRHSPRHRDGKHCTAPEFVQRHPPEPHRKNRNA